MAKAARQSLAFKAGMRARSYGWRGSQKAIARLKDAVSEIKAIRKRDPVAAGEGVVSLAERIWPAFEQIDTSSGALGNAVNRTLENLTPILIAAPADEATRAGWLERLYQAIREDGVQYLYPISERFGEIAVYPGLISACADRDIEMIRMAWTDRTAFGFVATETLCLSCLLEAGRNDELWALLDLRQRRMWSDDRFGAEALVRQGRCEEALAFAEERLAQERQAYDQREIGRFCEDVLIRLDRRDEAYARYGLSSGRGSTYLATWRDLARRYPERDAREILIDLMALHGNLGKWFAAAKDAGFLDLAQQCAADPNVEPATLVRAARDFRDRDPSFAAHVAMQAIAHYLAGRGYEPNPRDAEAAMTHLHHAARNEGSLGWAHQMLERLLADKTAKDMLMHERISRMMTLFEGS